MTQAALANALCVTPQAVSGWERGDSVPATGKLEQLSRSLGATVIELFHGTGSVLPRYVFEEMADKPELADRFTESDRRTIEERMAQIPGGLLVGARDFPIYAAAQGGDGTMIVHTNVMEYVKRPIVLEGVPEAYGISIVGTSMVPAYREGDMALVHPRRPPERETDVILYDHDHRTGDAKSMIKHLVSFNDRLWKLEQYNPAKTFSEHRADWPICHQVVGMYKGRR